MAAATASLSQLIAASPLDIDAVEAALDAMGSDERVSTVQGWNGAIQKRLWDATLGRGAVIADIVPEDVVPGTEVICAGRNSLPVFTIFEKRFTRVADEPNILYGYNESPTRRFIGPGYFVTRWFDDRSEVGVDYFTVPPEGARVPAAWPKIVPTERGLQRFVYGKTVDYMRKVSRHVTIGRAFTKGKETKNTFLLCRHGD